MDEKELTDEEKELLAGILSQEDIEWAYTRGQMGGWIPADDPTTKLIWLGLELLSKESKGKP